MRTAVILTHKFVEYIPENLDERTLYVSIPYATVVHKCCCGCGREVVTPLSPAAWSLSFNGESISLDPSIGNWALPCQSHYWIRSSRAEWASRWSAERIAGGREYEALRRNRHADSVPATESSNTPSYTTGKRHNTRRSTVWWKPQTWFR